MEWRYNLDPTRNSSQLANARKNTYTPALMVYCNIINVPPFFLMCVSISKFSWW
jgi:hypothetical protein